MMYNYSMYNQKDCIAPTNDLGYSQMDYMEKPPIGQIDPTSYGQISTTMPSDLGYSPNLFNSYDGFIRGNMFANLYDPYIANEPFNLIPQNEREALLNKVREYDFATTDLNLYLDTRPDDAEKIRTYNQFSTMCKQAKDEYELRYGPLNLGSETLNSYPWAWLTPPWPWEDQ